MSKPLIVVATVSTTLIAVGAAVVVGARNLRGWIRL